MKPHYLFIATTSLLWAGCRDSNPSLPSPPSTSKPTQATVTTPVSLTQVAQPQPPITTTVAPPVSTTITPPASATFAPFTPPEWANLSNDTIYFNQTSLLQKRPFRKHIGGLLNGYPYLGISYQSTDSGKRESFYLYAPARIGRHTTQAMREPTTGYMPSFNLLNYDVIAGYYVLDPTADNWIEITAIDEAKRAVAGRFSIHLKRDMPATTSTPAYEAQYPKEVHMHGSFNY